MTDLTDFRKAKDAFFGKDHRSPLTAEQKERFGGLDYFPENPAFQFALELEEFADESKDVVPMITSTGETVDHLRWGQINFEVGAEKATLTVYRATDGEEFFLPFADTNAGKSTYGAGRYLDVVELDHHRLLIDFNYAYNPYCAYNPGWSCPIPPAENRLKVAVEAGEKVFPDAEY